MTVSLGGLSLSDELLLDIAPAGIAYNHRRLIGGASVVQADGNIGGRLLTLSGTHHWTMGQVEQIREMESTGLPVTLVHHRGTFTMIIIDTTKLEPSINFKDPVASTWYTGSITGIEV